MATTRIEPSKMSKNSDMNRKGQSLRLRRLLICVGAALALTLALASAASARTVYDYVYSGQYIDGSAGGKPFNDELADLAYDRHADRLIVVNGGSPGTVSRYNSAGAPLAFASLGTPWFTVEPSIGTDANITVDQSGTSNDGNFYIRTGGAGILLTEPDGTTSEFEPQGSFFGADCGIAVSPDGTELLTTVGSNNGLMHFALNGKFLDRKS